VGQLELAAPVRQRLLVIVAAAAIGGGVGSGVTLLLDEDEAGPRGAPGPPGPSGAPVLGDVGVLEARIAGLEERVEQLERELRPSR
jgi:hypothetical protein